MKIKSVTYFFHEESETWFRVDESGTEVYMLNETKATGKIKQALLKAFKKEF